MELVKKLKSRRRKTGGKYDSWGVFRCPSCGSHIERIVQHGRRFKSCGCARIKSMSEGRKKHGYAPKGNIHPLYKVFRSIITRCENPKAKDYHRYGGRGISICKGWREHPGKFIEWALTNGYQKGLQIDRIDNNGNYEPSNCHFVTPAMNVRNSRNIILTINDVHEIRQRYSKGEIFQRELAKEYNVSSSTICKIINNKLWKE